MNHKKEKRVWKTIKRPEKKSVRRSWRKGGPEDQSCEFMRSLGGSAARGHRQKGNHREGGDSYQEGRGVRETEGTSRARGVGEKRKIENERIGEKLPVGLAVR